MKLTNFEQTQSVSLQGLGHHWDLHNEWDFAGVELLPELGAVRLRWRALREYIDPGNRAVWCAIRFDGVTAMWVTRAKDQSDWSDATTLHEMGLVAPLALTPAKAIELGARVPPMSEDANYLFEFMDGFDIEIAARQATLEAEFASPAAIEPKSSP